MFRVFGLGLAFGVFVFSVLFGGLGAVDDCSFGQACLQAHPPAPLGWGVVVLRF